ncbi:MAG: sulfatase-like hydrolase/transferase [Planctomycetaceae bacterium]|jgi:arylsulfatase A|nr:sulfatase-like hydrolase/transferase [Planctomycetaceae bacterium]MDC0308544.1 sulfatase-like hydrolase/transferase [Planctomycetaceae bacterium]MDG2388156.1 sulfatase-like hydrolase/transferase [Planctomycetaceae bacterium]
MTMRVLLLAVLSVVAPYCSASAAGKPNIILIMADDLGMEGLGCYGGKSYKTPHLDKLAEQGLRFTHAYSQPLCTPTRVQFMTGKYNQRNWQSFGILPKQEQTFGHLMSARGYQTLIAGKWQLTSYDPPDFPGAEKRRGTGTHPKDAGFDEYMLFHSEETEDKGSRYANPTFMRNGTLHKEWTGKYGEDLTVDYILDFMKRNQNEPMFVYYPMALPHWPMVPTPISKVWSDPSRRLEESTEYFPDMVEYMDQLVGRVVEGVDKLGLRKNTLIIFYSDNGTDLRITSQFKNRSIKGGKGQPTQTGIRVPLIANWPGQIEAGICRDLIDASDFFPTLAELAGEKLSQDWFTDGVSFTPQLFGNKGTPRDSAFFWYDPRPGWDKDQFQRDIFALDKQYKLFADGRLFHIGGTGFREKLVDREQSTPETKAARIKLQAVINKMMQPPLSHAATHEVDAFGNSVK